MGDKVNPWCHWPNPAWKFNIDSSADNLYPPDGAGLDDTTSSVALPMFLNNHSSIYPGVVAPMPFLTASVADILPLSMPSRFVTTLAPGLESPGVYPPHDERPLVLYQKESHTPITAPLLLAKGVLDPVPELQGSNETNVTDVGAQQGTQGVHENTDEINALLESDSGEGYERVCELGKAMQCPAAENDALSVESVASADAASARPAKKRRLCSGTDKSVVDTASSARPDHSIEQKLLAGDCDAQSCCIGEVESDRKFIALREEGEAAAAAAEGDSPDDDDDDHRERRRERIQETVAALRKIVPGGVAKDATAILDEAICYLQYLKLKVNTLGAVSL